MTIGVLQLEIRIGDAMSLKDKRRVVKGLKDRIAHGHNVSIAEVGAMDEHRRAIIGMAMVSNDARYVEGALSKLVDMVRMTPLVELLDYQIEMLQGSMSRRTERLASIIQQELSAVIMHELHDPRLQGLPSITRVRVSPDLSVADVFMTIMGTKGQQTAALNALQHSAGLMRTRLTKSLTIRQSPFLKFHLDENAKKEIEILDLIRKASEETAESDRRRAEAAAGGEAGAESPAQADSAMNDSAVPPTGDSHSAPPGQTE